MMFSMISDDKQRSELETFYKENQNRFLNAAYLKLHDKGEAEDAVQDAFLEIIKAPDHLLKRDPEKRIGYMIRVIKFISVDMYNKKTNRPIESFDEEEIYNHNPFLFENDASYLISANELKRFIETLPALQRDVLKSRCFMGHSTAETAKMLHISQTAVKKRLRLAKEAIREYIRKENEIHE